MAVQAVNSASAGTATTATTTKSTTIVDKNAFLNLLVSQLKYQDPMDPMKADQFMSQLAQMTQVEQLQNISDSLETMNKAVSTASPGQWVSAIGKKISVDSKLLSKGDMVYLSPTGDYDKMLITLKKSNGSTTEVAMEKGDLAYTYDGADVVSFGVSVTKDKWPVETSYAVYQVVKGVQIDSNGAATLASGTGETYTINKVKQIIQ